MDAFTRGMRQSSARQAVPLIAIRYACKQKHITYEENMTLQDATNIATIIGSLALIGVFLQIILARKQLKADHERSRREKSVELLLEWTKNLKEDSSSARKIVESLDEEQCRNLFSQDDTRIPKKYNNSLKKILSISEDLKEENGHIVLSGDKVSKLRWHIMIYLNLLESILVAWQYSIVDRDIIEHQFSYLFSLQEGHAALKSFRTAAGGERTFPAIAIFANHLEEKRRSTLKEKANVA